MRESSGRSSRGNAPESPGELRHIRVLRELSDEHLARIFPLLRRQSMRARSTIVFEGEFENAVTFIWSGRVRMTAVAPTGISISLSSMGPGSLFGHGLAVMRYKPQANIRLVADETASLLLLPASEFSALLSVSLPLVTALMHEFAQNGAMLASRVYELATLDVRARLLAELARLADQGLHVDGATIITHTPTHAALGAQIGATREVVTRQLNDLEQEGVIRVGRGVIEITDLARLRAMDQEASGRFVFRPQE